jgi:2-(1,2-epoxy-1,2-dihydrophenyl)acetyl-CoA isomerase
MAESIGTITGEIKERVMTITLDHPKVNALNLEMVLALGSAFKAAARQDEVGCVLLNARGENFSAGQDLAEAARVGETSYRNHLLRTYNPLILQIRQLEKPVLAALQGAVAGAALGIALACDLRIAAEDTRIVVGFLGIGLAPDSGVSLLLPTLIGLGRAAELAFTNQPLDADHAHAWGLVNRVVPRQQLDAQSFAWAQELAHTPTKAVGLTKRAFNHATLSHLEDVLDYEAHLQDIAQHTPEHQQALRKFGS